MAEQFKLLYQGTLDDAPSQLFAVGAGKQVIIRHIQVVNSDSFNRTFKLWQNGTANANLVLPASVLLAGGYASFNGTMTMESGNTLHAASDEADKVTMNVYGMEVTS